MGWKTLFHPEKARAHHPRALSPHSQNLTLPGFPVLSPQRRFPVCPVAELPPGERRIVEVDGRSIGVFNVHGTFHALKNQCPHEGAELCRGLVTGMTMPGAVGEYRWEREGEILRCPWHGWEFDLLTGRCVFAPSQIRVKAYDIHVERFATEVEDEWLVLYV